MPPADSSSGKTSLDLIHAIAAIPAGLWAVGVSGGADSVALLTLLCERSDLSLHVVHLNHETRGKASDDDAAFVHQLAVEHMLPVTSARLREVEAWQQIVPRNPSARYRAARLALFERVVHAHSLLGVILAHHADDQAETVLHRLLRGGRFAGLGGIRAESRIGDLRILHPLLDIAREDLRKELARRQVAWREDASNASPRYLRNRLRRLLQSHPELHEPLLQLGHSAATWRKWLDRAAPHLPQVIPVALLHALSEPLASHAAARWLRERGAPSNDLTPTVVDRLLTMARDAASTPRRHFPGDVLIRRRGGFLFVDVPS